MAEATEATVLGDFAGTAFERDGVVSRFLRRDGKFVVQTDGPDGRLADFVVAYTFGVHPLQQYLIAQPGGRLQALTTAWDAERRRWFDPYPHERTPPGDVLHWTGRYQSWNAACASCHSTDLEKNYDARGDRYATTWSEIRALCVNCHMPARNHMVIDARRDHAFRIPRPDLSTKIGTPDACSGCHADRTVAWAADAIARWYGPERRREAPPRVRELVDGIERRSAEERR